ncbi:MAG: phasin family protein [Gammaproteobacteria bacterium]|nr:phasin family protein [Gammaproteobacteria bacterium]
MAARKKAVTKKAKARTIADRFEGTIIEQPIVIANKTFLASLGLASQVQADFDAKFEALAKDGEKVRKQAQDSLGSLRNKLFDQVKTTRDEITKRVESAVSTVLEHTPVATTGDVEKLNKKLDKMLVQVAK